MGRGSAYIRIILIILKNSEELLEGVKVLYNTYWVRFNHRLFTHADAVRNSLTLFEAAKKAGVERIVHVSITNPSSETSLEYFQGKAILEKAVIDSGLSYAILRPAVLFGKEDILINNIAWALRKLPVFGVFGDGNYGIQPIYIDDFADLAVKQGELREDSIINAVGPELFTYKELVKTIGRLIGKNRPVISVSSDLRLHVCQSSRLAGGRYLLDLGGDQGSYGRHSGCGYPTHRKHKVD